MDMIKTFNESGFKLTDRRDADEISAVIWELEHEKSGAKLAWIDRKDKNMTFAISFATPPEDDTGVFHIIEHSVLCGSEKYPLRDPFAELLKGSLNTFLNAMTYEDRTVYPVSSGCKKDFLNLTDVYLDAVLRPNLLTNPSIFAQEGWHYEYDEERNALSRSGVVYNEMKGAYSSPDEAGQAALVKALFGGTRYGCDSGGDPNAIPKLTYEKFVEFYKKYYHPSNALIILDGSVDIGEVLSLIDSHLSRYDRSDVRVHYEKSEPTITPTVKIRYEADQEEDRARLLLGYVWGGAMDRQGQILATILCDYLCGSNSAPLKRALLDSGLCHDVGMYTSKSYEQTVVIELRDMKSENIEPARQLVDEVLGRIISEGLDKKRLSGILNSVEFSAKERDYGTLPKGISFALSALSVWHYGGAPEKALLHGEVIKAVRELIDTDYLERALGEMTLNCPHRASVAMIPDTGLSEERAELERKELHKILESLSADELAALKEADRKLKAWQTTEESDDAIATLPTLEISDIDEAYSVANKHADELSGARVLTIDIETDGIIYAGLMLDGSDLSKKELTHLGLLARMLGELPTKKSTPLELQSRIRSELGSLSFTGLTVEKHGIPTPYLRANASVLEQNKDSLTDIFTEILLETDFSSIEAIAEICEQERSAFEEELIGGGHTAAIARVEAMVSAGGAVTEYMHGYEAYTELCRIVKNEEYADLASSLSGILKKLAVKERLTLTVSGERDHSFAESTVSRFPSGSIAGICAIAPLGIKREFIKIPTKVAYAVTGAIVPEAKEFVGTMRVARSILSYEHLWQTIRVVGGAYGAGFVVRKNGLGIFYSYRDPSPKTSLTHYSESADYLRTLADTGTDVTKFVIGAYGEYDVISTPKTMTAIAIADYLTEWTEEKEKKLRHGILTTDADSLRRVADVISGIADSGAVCVVGGAEHLESFDNEFDRILSLNPN